MTRVVPCLTVLFALVAHAWGAPRAVRLQATVGLPFSDQELADAVSLRLPVASAETPAEQTIDVTLEALDNGDVRLSIDGAERAVQLDQRRGLGAARMVALLIVDLVQARESPALPSSEGPPVVTARAAPAVATAPAARRVRSGTFVGVEAVTHVGFSDADPSFGAALRGAWALRARLGITATLGVSRVADSAFDGNYQAVMEMLPARLGLVWRGTEPASFWSVAGGVAGMPYQVAGSGGLSTRGALGGAWLAAELAWPGGSAWQPYALVGLDVWTQPVVFRGVMASGTNVTVLETNRLSPSLAIGVRWNARRVP